MADSLPDSIETDDFPHACDSIFKCIIMPLAALPSRFQENNVRNSIDYQICFLIHDFYLIDGLCDKPIVFFATLMLGTVYF